MIPKDGSNAFNGSLFYVADAGRLAEQQLHRRARGAADCKAPNRVEKILDFNPGFGGPVKKNKLWFFRSFRRWGVDQTVTDSFYNADPTHRTFQAGPRCSRRSTTTSSRAACVRLTYQMSRRAQVRRLRATASSSSAATSARRTRSRPPRPAASAARSGTYTAQVKYTGTLTSSLLVEAGWSENDETYSTNETQPRRPRSSDIGRLDRTTTDRWGSVIGPYYFREPDRHTFSGAVSYVTGRPRAEGRLPAGQGLATIISGRMNGGIDLYQEYHNKVPASVIDPQHAAGHRARSSSTTSGSTCRTRCGSTA